MITREAAALARLCVAVASLSLVSCSALRSSPEVRTALSATRAAATGLLELIEFIEGNGGPQDMADSATEALREKDYGKSIAACYLGIETMRANGVVVPEHIDRALYMVRGAMAARAFDDLAKAMRSTLAD